MTGSNTIMERRKFIIRSAVLRCSAAASPLITPIALAQAPWEQRLVVIILRGGMDGLEVVRPVGDPLFSRYRPTLAKVGAAILTGSLRLTKTCPI